MYELYQIQDNLYQVHSYEEAIEGTLLAIGTYWVYSLGFNPVELEAALLDMIRQDKDSAHFDSRGNFVYSFIKSQKYGKAS